MLELTDQEAIKKIKGGEIDNFSYIVKKYTKPIYSFVYSKLFNKDEVEDLVQKTFLQLYIAIDRFDEKKPVLPYLYQIAKNELKMYYRSFKKTQPLNEEILYQDKGVERQEDDDINQLVEKLPNEQKMALKYLYEGYSYQEIANKLKKPVNTIKTIVRRARLKLIKYKT